jgi:hypothetical protein
LLNINAEPSLVGGDYTISVNQTVQKAAADGSEAMNPAPVSTQHLKVHAPRFQLPPGIVHSTYPPQGLGDKDNVLPHMVFEDPHFPWEQSGSPIQDEKDDENERKTGKIPINKVPWVALLTFTETELRLSEQELGKKSQGGLFPEVTRIPSKSIPPPAGREQNKSTFSVQLTMQEYLEMGSGSSPTVVTPIWDSNKMDPIDPDIQADVIFPPASLADDLLVSYDDSGARVPFPSDGTKVLPDLSRFKWLSHVRDINTANVAGAGSNDDGLYSVVHAHRTGPLDIKTATPVIVHLVTLEGLEVSEGETPHVQLPLSAAGQPGRVAFVSLYSWTYLCLPPGEVNFMDSMRRIGFSIESNQCWLRTPDDVIAKFTAASKPTANTKSSPPAPPTPQQLITSRLADRSTDGFCLQRYRLQTGEETVAFYRGPFTPKYMKPIDESWWPYQSNFSSDYQIIDPQLGTVDITYSAAWQLGKTLAIADQAYTAALVRLRGVIQTTGRRGTLKEQAAQPSKSKAEVTGSLSNTVDLLTELAFPPGEKVPSSLLHRHQHHALKPPKFRRKGAPDEIVSPDEVNNAFFRYHVHKTARHLGSAKVPKAAAPSPPAPSPDDDVFIPFNDISVPVSTDWQIVQNWLLDNMFFKNIPAHYFIPDASYLPLESIRFFYVDSNWVDAFIDGALSVGNHLDREDDVVRQALKYNLNSYLKTKYSVSHPGQPDLNYYPQMPCFGFLLRSAVVHAFPDLEIHAPWNSGDDKADGKREPTLRFEAIAKDTLLCLFDRMPGSAHWDPDLQITLSQPPHQQCFRVGVPDGLTVDKLEVEIPPVYSTTDTPPNVERYAPLRAITWYQNGSAPTGEADISVPKAVFDWNSRMIPTNQFAAAAQAVLAHDLTVGTKQYYDNANPTSAMVGTVLTSYVSKMRIDVPKTTITDPNDPRLPQDFTKQPRQIRIPDLGPTDPDQYEKVPDDPDPNDGPIPPSPPLPPTPKPTPPHPHSTSGLPGVPSGFKPDAEPLIPPCEVVNVGPDKDPIRGLNAQFPPVIFPLGTVPPPTSSYPPVTIQLPTAGSAADHPVDLVVSMVRTKRHDVDHNLQLFCITVEVPVGDRPDDLIRAATKPTAARMLTNVRFNVHVSPLSHTDSGGHRRDKLVFTLIPRSQGLLVPLRNTAEVSFVIYQVALNSAAGMPAVQITENYRWQNGQDRAKGYRVVAPQPNLIVLSKIAPVPTRSTHHTTEEPEPCGTAPTTYRHT